MKNLKIGSPLIYAAVAAVAGFVIVRQVFAAKGTRTTYRGNIYADESAAQSVKDTDALFRS